MATNSSLPSQSCTRGTHNHRAAGYEWQTAFAGLTALLVVMHRAQVVLINRGSDGASQSRSGVLVGAEVNAAVDSGVGDVVRNLLKRRVLQDDAGHRRIRQRNEMPHLAIQSSHDLGCAAASAAVVGRITRETRRHNEGGIVRVGFRFSVAVCVAAVDCRLRAPEHVVILVVERGYEAIADSHVDQGQSTGIFRERMVALQRGLPGCLIEYLRRCRDLVVEHDVRAVHWPFGAVETADCHYFVVSLRIQVACQRGRRGEEKSVSVRDAEWSHTLPVEEGPFRDPIENRAAWRGLVRSGNRWPRSIERERCRAVIGAKSDDGGSGSLADGNAILLGLAVRN